MSRKYVLAIVLGFLAIGLFAQDFYDMGTVNNIQLFFTQTNWDQLLDQLYAAGENRLLGSAIINGVAYDSVGVRYKGNSSYNANRNKNPFNIKLDHIIDDQTIGPYGTIKLANGFSDPSFIRETLSYEIARKYMPASRANYANVYVNNQLIGVYTSVQDVDSYFMSEHFHCGGMPRFKSGTNTMLPTTVWGYLGADSLAYDNLYDLESNHGWATLMNFTYTLQNNYANIANAMNVDQNLWMCAFDNLFVNLDSPINVFHNFYLFSDADNRINPLLWDLNMSFGGFQGGTITQMQQLDPLRNSTSNTYLLLKNILITPRYKKQYIAHMRTMITENITNGWYSTRASELQAICGPHVQADPNFFYTYANFLANLNSAVSGGSGGPGGGQTIPGITQLMGTRGNYLLNSTPFSGTVPTLTNHGFSPAEVEPGDTVQFTATATDAIYMHLGFRQNHAHKFDYHQMYDDGAHGDGAAGDGVWGVSVPVAYGNIEYFFWAENASQGMFFPPRAEYEFFSIPVASTTGEILINEIMAKNASYADPNGQFDDWVELYNPNEYSVDIGGMYMTDNHYSSGIQAWTQIPTTNPALTTIPPHGYLIVWFDEDLDQGPLHINDKLSGAADAVYLIAADGQTVVDSFTWTEAQDLNVDDRSIGRMPDGGQSWVLFGAGQDNPSTPGAANQGTVNEPPSISGISYSPLVTTAQTPVTVSATVTDTNGDLSSVTLLYGSDENDLESLNMVGVGTVFSATIGPFELESVIKFRIQATDANDALTQTPLYTIIIGYSAPVLYINELMPSNTSTITDENGEYEDWVEIFNPNGFEVDLAGYYLTDNHYPEIGASLTQIPAGYPETVIPAYGFKLIWFDEHLSQGPLHINTKLGTTADAAYLIAPDMLRVIDQIAWTADIALSANLSYARYPNGSDTWIVCGDGYPHAVTPGMSNSPSTNEDDLIGALKPTLKVYPNPAQKDLKIELVGSKTPYQVQIYNLKGQLVYDAKVVDSSKTTWNGTDKTGRRAGNGIYFVSVATASGRQIKKICLAQ